jgi:hypothetical protein
MRFRSEPDRLRQKPGIRHTNPSLLTYLAQDLQLPQSREAPSLCQPISRRALAAGTVDAAHGTKTWHLA